MSTMAGWHAGMLDSTIRIRILLDEEEERNHDDDDRILLALLNMTDSRSYSHPNVDRKEDT